MALYSMVCTDGLLLHLEARGGCWSTRGLHLVMVNSGTQFGKVIIKVARKVRAGHAQCKHSPTEAWAASSVA